MTKLKVVPEGYDPHAWRIIRDKKCTACKLHQTADRVCETGTGSMEFSKIWVVSKMPNSARFQQQLEEALSDAGLDPKQIYYTSAVKCRTFEQDASNLDVKTCRQYLDREIHAGEPRWILALGNEALLATTGHSGITKYRTKVYEFERPTTKGMTKYKVIPTISPAMVNRNPGLREGWMADLRFFVAQVQNKTAKLKPPGIFFVDTKEKFNKLKVILKNTKVLAYDIETVGETEWALDANIVSLSGTSELYDGRVITWALPLYHPQSPFRSSWQRVLQVLKLLLETVPIQTAHNGKYDARWMRKFGVWMRVEFDTMLACHLLDENALKRLKAQCTARFGVADWSIDTLKLLDTPIRQVLEYNAKDTYYQYHLRLETKQQLIEEPRLLRIFQLMLMPANELLIEAERKGIWRDPERLATATKQANDMRAEIERQLMEFVPEPSDDIGWPHEGRKAKFREVNFNPSNFARWFIFDYLEMPIIKRGKDKQDGSPGDPSMAEDVMLELKGKHPVIKLMLDRVKWQKYCSSFLPQYDALADRDGRIHTSFKLFGTVTGRLSSGKEDPDKVTAVKKIRGVNIQQVPRDPLIRGIFGAPPGWDFVEADFSQVELRVVAFLSRDRTMMRLFQLGEDIHLATASNVLGIPPSQVDKETRKKAKAINFGFVYGMGWKKFIATAFEKYELIFTEAEARQIRRLFFEQFTGLLPWHARQRRLVNQYGRVQSPIGRIRHLPDIYSGEQGVRAEAERQAINSPVQSFASDMTVIALIEISRKFKEQKIKGFVIGTVHDALLFEIHKKHTARALPIIKETMENLPLEKKFGVHLDIPIVADIKIGGHWAGDDVRELTTEEVYNYAA